MNFEEALQALKDGKKVTRAIWGGYWYIPKTAKLLDTKVDGVWQNDHEMRIIVAVLKDGSIAPAQPYQSDLLSEDWRIVD